MKLTVILFSKKLVNYHLFTSNFSALQESSLSKLQKSYQFFKKHSLKINSNYNILEIIKGRQFKKCEKISTNYIL